LLKTPTTQDARIGPNNIGGNKHRVKRGSIALADQILFPTPTTMDHIDRKGMRPSRAATNRKSGYLSEMIKMYPTPMARDYKDVSFNTTWKLGNKAQPTMARTVLKNNKLGGKLNPTFVEFLMGYPMNWTKIELTE